MSSPPSLIAFAPNDAWVIARNGGSNLSWPSGLRKNVYDTLDSFG